jgi:predicted secreted protein
MQKRTVVRLCLFAFFCAAPRASAGDVASFVDLGFSENDRHYAFAQYGVEEASLLPWAEFFMIDVSRNDFVPDGKKAYKHDKEIEAGQDGNGALLRLVTQNTALAGKYGVNFLRLGNALFISLENGHNPSGETIEFRDFDTGASYRASLRPVVHGSGASLTSSFTIHLERDGGGGGATTPTIGTPEVRRARITSYTIKKALISPDKKSLVFVIEMTRQNSGESAPDIRYMVEAVRFPR